MKNPAMGNFVKGLDVEPFELFGSGYKFIGFLSNLAAVLENYQKNFQKFKPDNINERIAENAENCRVLSDSLMRIKHRGTASYLEGPVFRADAMLAIEGQKIIKTACDCLSDISQAIKKLPGDIIVDINGNNISKDEACKVIESLMEQVSIANARYQGTMKKTPGIGRKIP